MRIQILTIFSFLTFLTFGQEGRYKNINEAIANADRVTELWISSDADSIPSAISACKNLESIRFDQLNSEFDIESALMNISKLDNLKEVHFWYFNETTPPSNLRHLNQVQHIEFYSSPSLELNLYFEKMESLSNLDMLTLRSMSLTSIPDEIVKLKSLKYLNLDDNDQLDLPKLFNTLAKLKIEELNLSSAKFSVVPVEITQLKDLRVLSLEMIQGKFNNIESYTTLSNLKKLECLNVQGNFFKAFDPSIALLKNLKRIEVDGNCLTEKELKKLKKFLPNTEIQNEIPC